MARSRRPLLSKRSGLRPQPYVQTLLPFRVRSLRRDRLFRVAILASTAVVACVATVSSPAARALLRTAPREAAVLLERAVGVPPNRDEIDAIWSVRRARGVEVVEEKLAKFYRGTTPEMRRLFDVAGMAPGEGVVRWGFGDGAFVVSSRVFEPDDHGRAYRMRPNVRSIWLRQITLKDGLFGMFQVLDEPETLAVAARAGAIPDLGSRQTTNSWGCRGPEPDPGAPIRGIVLGDSFMQGMFLDDAHTPSVLLERDLAAALGTKVSVLNTGHIGYSPEQYFHALTAYYDRLRPNFAVVSVCPNDFGDGPTVMMGGGDWDEAEYWLDQIAQFCRTRSIACVLVPVPVEDELLGHRDHIEYPSRVPVVFDGGPTSYRSLTDSFTDEHLRLAIAARSAGKFTSYSPLYNGQISDNHFSEAGSALWAKLIARRLAYLFEFRNEPMIDGAARSAAR